MKASLKVFYVADFAWARLEFVGSHSWHANLNRVQINLFRYLMPNVISAIMGYQPCQNKLEIHNLKLLNTQEILTQEYSYQL